MLEPAFVQVGGGSIAAVEQVELAGGLGQFVVEEVLRGDALTVVEVSRLAVRGQSLLEPNPGNDDVTDGFEVHRGVRQCAGGITAVPKQSSGALDSPRRRCKRASPLVQRMSQRRRLIGRVPDLV